MGARSGLHGERTGRASAALRLSPFGVWLFALAVACGALEVPPRSPAPGSPGRESPAVNAPLPSRTEEPKKDDDVPEYAPWEEVPS